MKDAGLCGPLSHFHKGDIPQRGDSLPSEIWSFRIVRENVEIAVLRPNRPVGFYHTSNRFSAMVADLSSPRAH